MPENETPDNDLPESKQPGTSQTGNSQPAYRARVEVRLKRSILDPQGRAVENTLKRLGHDNLADLRVGKIIELTLSGERDQVEAQLQEIADKVLSNPVMEDVSYTLERVDESQGAARD